VSGSLDEFPFAGSLDEAKDRIIKLFASHEDDLSDVSVYHQVKSPSSVTEYTLLDVSDGPKTVLNLSAFGRFPEDTAGYSNTIGPVTIDGASNTPFPSENSYDAQDYGGDFCCSLVGGPFRYDKSLKVEWQHAGTGYKVRVDAQILGSGPYSIAVVRDGDPVYMTAENVSEETIEQMNVTDGYKIVRDPEIVHENPQIRGMWDDDKERVVDHPYWKPFYDTLDKLNGMRRRAGSQAVLEKIERNPTSFENVYRGENPMEDPVEEAVQFWYEREKKQSTDLSELEKIRGK